MKNPLKTRESGSFGTELESALEAPSSRGDSFWKAKPTSWDLSDLYEGPDDPRIERDENSALEEAKRFAADYRGKIAVAGGPSPELVQEALRRYETLIEAVRKPVAFAALLHAADTTKAAHGALLARTQDLATKLQTRIMFFELDWISLTDEEAARCLESPRCARWAHFLRRLRRYKPHTLSEPEEIIHAEKRVTGVLAFRRLYDEFLSSAKFDVALDGEAKSLSQSEVLALLYSDDRKVRQEAHRGFSEGLGKLSHLTTFTFNTTVQDHAIDTRLRKYEDPADPRHLSNEIDRASVKALMEACEENNSVVRDYYRLKGRLLGLDRLYDFDRYAPVNVNGVGIPLCTWEKACDIVVSAFADFSPRLGETVVQFLKNRWVDAEVRPGKRSGAFCAATVPAVHPYILTNFMGKLNDAMTLAHELGHGVHQYLGRSQGVLQSTTPLTLAETASVFGEMLVFDRLVSQQIDPKVKLSLYCHRLEDSFATVFRQIVMTRFEERVHAARLKGELSTEDFDRFWLEANQPMLGDAVELTDGYKRWWSYVNHFVQTPFYCYAYSFGELLVLSLWSHYKKVGQSFVPKYIELLEAGGSDTPANLIGKVGLDVNDPQFWKAGIGVLEDMLKQAQRLAEDYLT